MNEVEMNSMTSNSSHIQELSLGQENRDNVRLNQPAEARNNNARPIPPQQSWLSQMIFRHSKKMKWAMIILIFAFMLWLGSKLSSQLIKSRHPMFLSSFNTDTGVQQVMSPQQSDYRSFKYYQKMLELAKKATAENREPTENELKQFDNITFKQFYNSYKVIRTIQLGKQFTRTQKEQEQLGEVIDQSNLDQFINKTQFFSDAVDQFQCASCYSFPIAATVQYMYKFYYNITVKLSEQQLIDCAHDDPEANGCDDGNITKGFEYVQKHGLVSTQQYPYRSIAGNSFKCDEQIFKKTKSYKISGFRKLPVGKCQAIQNQLIKGNVVASMINAGDLSSYTSGTFTDCKRSGLNHAVTIVGQTQKNEWIIRNSWGKSFGNNGYFLMGHGNTCGICTHAIVPILKLNDKMQAIPYDPKDDKIQVN